MLRLSVICRCALAVALSSAAVIPSIACIAADEPAWHSLRLGQLAYLGESDDENVAVCPMSYVFDRRNDATTCPTIPRGTIVKISAIQHGKLDTSGDDAIAVEVRAASGSGRTGWVNLINMNPIVPVGTRIVLHKDSYWPHLDSAARDSVDIPDGTIGEVLKQLPPSGNAEYLMRFVSGSKRGVTGWMLLSPEDVVAGTAYPVEMIGT